MKFWPWKRPVSPTGPADGEERVHFSRQAFPSQSDFDSGRVIQNMDFVDCVFEGSGLSMGKSPERRTVVRRVTLKRCRDPIRSTHIGSPILDEVEIEDLRAGGIVLINGAAFRHVILRGGMPNMNFNELPDAEEYESLRRANRAFYTAVDWALDISQANFNSVAIRGLPGELIRRDEETQILVSKPLLLEAGWEKLPLPAITRIHVESVLLQQHERQVIVAGKRSKTFHEEIRGLELLRRVGAAI